MKNVNGHVMPSGALDCNVPIFAILDISEVFIPEFL